jgi:hypothetical protein
MSDQAAPEPTMEEILASIRRIISEDDAPAADAAHADDGQWRPPPAAAEAEPPPVAEADAEDDVLELTEPATAEIHGDVEAHVRASDLVAHAAAPEPATLAAASWAQTEAAPDSLVAPEAVVTSSAAFGKLAEAISKPEPAPPAPPSPALPAAGRTLEDLTRDLLRPLLKQWLDENLPRIVQTSVDAEVDRIARGRVR